MSTSTLARPSRSAEADASRSSEFISSPLPDWIWSDVERLYQSVFSSRVMLEKPELTQSLPYAWVEKKEHQITDVLVFRKDGCTIQIANEVIALPSDVIERFSNDIFANYPSIQFIRLHAVKLQSSLKNSMAFKSEFSEDYVLTIPVCKEGWLASLSARTRERLGDGVLKDDAKAVNYFRDSANLGHEDAQVQLGLMYEKGRGFDSDEKKAFDLFLNAAHEDNTNTQFEVGRMYLDGTVVVKDDDV
jgi:hypothetical protein